MTPDQRETLFRTMEGVEDSIRAKKGKDYAGNEDVLANFKRNAERLGLTKYQVWLVYFMKHIDAISNAIKSNPNIPDFASESSSERIHDARIYLGLLACLIEEDSIFQGKPQAPHGEEVYVFDEGSGEVRKLKPWEPLAVNRLEGIRLATVEEIAKAHRESKFADELL